MNLDHRIWPVIALFGAVACGGDADDDPSDDTSGSGGATLNVGVTPVQTGGRSFTSSGGQASNTGGTSSASGGTFSGGTGPTGGAPSNTGGVTSSTGGSSSSSGGTGGTTTNPSCGLHLGGMTCQTGASCQWTAPGETGTCQCTNGRWECIKRNVAQCPSLGSVRCGSACTTEVQGCLCGEGGGGDFVSCACTGGVWKCGSK